MAEEKFEKKKLDQNDYKQEENSIKTAKNIAGVISGILAVVGIVVGIFTKHDPPNDKTTEA